MKKRARISEMIVILTIVILGIATVALANPGGVDSIVVENSTRRSYTEGAKSTPAEAGNTTQLSINTTSVTKTWQGYFGDVSGSVTLDDGNNNTMYDWTVAEPTGEIYATNATTAPSWGDVECFDLTDDNYLTAFESYIGLNANDDDGINETFNSQAHSAFAIGTRTITANTCWGAKTYVSGAAQSSTSNFIEVVMHDNTTNSTVWVTLINNSVTGFDGVSRDFQMLVPVAGGHEVTPLTDTFYFYIELS